MARLLQLFVVSKLVAWDLRMRWTLPIKALKMCHAMLMILLQVKEELRLAFTPQGVQAPERQAPLPAWQETVQQLSGPANFERAALSRSEQIQVALCRTSKRYTGQFETDRMAAQTSTKAPTLMAAGEQHHKLHQRVGSGAPAHSTEAGAGSRRDGNGQRGADAGKGFFQWPHKKPRVSTGPARSSVQDAAFFMGLQQDHHVQASSEVSECSDDSLAAG